MNTKKNRNSILLTVLIFLFTIIGIALIVTLFSKFSYVNKYKGIKEYQVLMPIKDDARNMNLCPKGCIRGVCNKSNNDNSCKYDFQCDYCQDKKTNMFYVNFETEKEREIIPVYEEKSLNYNQTELLNKEINKNNTYINALNKKIKIMNT